MRHRARLAPLAVAAVLAALLAGCADPSASADLPEPTAVPSTMAIVGVVQDASFAPVAGAAVSIRLLGESAVTDAAGGFRFDGLAPSAYLVDVNATGFLPATLTAEPEAGAGSTASLTFLLERPASLQPAIRVQHFRGILQCAFEALIISPSCDTAVEAGGGPSLFNDTASFDAPVDPNWGTVVVDVDFDPGQHPGLAGLRLAARGASDAGETGQYEQFGRFNGSGPFTVRLAPGGEYPDGNGPVPASTSLFHFDVYPHSHGWHPGGAGLLGVGAAFDVTFDVYVSVFYNQQAPDGYTLLGA